MPYINNVSMHNFNTGNYPIRTNHSTIAIRITDPEITELPPPVHEFVRVHHFCFLDADERTLGIGKKYLISDKQAKEIAEILDSALENDQDVIVNCHAGICRSGAVTEVGVMLGFTDMKSFRYPNTLVKRKLMAALDLLPNGAIHD